MGHHEDLCSAQKVAITRAGAMLRMAYLAQSQVANASFP